MKNGKESPLHIRGVQVEAPLRYNRRQYTSLIHSHDGPDTMKTLGGLAILACVAFAAGDNVLSYVERRSIASNLTLDNGLDWGVWGDVEYCPEGSFVHAFDTKFESGSTTDETAVNALMLFCSTPEHHDTGYITSTVGEYGEWQGMRICTNGYVTGMRGNVLEPQGIVHDDVAVANMEMECDYGKEVITGVMDLEKFTPGEWGEWSKCDSGSAVCGLQVKWEEPVLGDDAATTNVILFCCSL
ncbi:vitelline membrane outer layer protein 1-like [Penaeus japonicus]|uniref:vitelline membrane outer layer protein 1-like n=1 Tax=Penaeus japonicus TaxID=27405 RepID=UPI001C70ED00|nr:vitelline membrane outer layer protein 1-like [Penaeus japonicus]